MSEPTPAAAPANVEITADAIVARAGKKLLDEAELKSMQLQIDAASASAEGKSAIPVVVIDLAPVQLLPSMAIGLLVQMANKCRVRGQKLKLAAVQPQVRQMLCITKLDRVFEFAASVEAATP